MGFAQDEGSRAPGDLGKGLRGLRIARIVRQAVRRLWPGQRLGAVRGMEMGRVGEKGGRDRAALPPPCRRLMSPPLGLAQASMQLRLF